MQLDEILELTGAEPMSEEDVARLAEADAKAAALPLPPEAYERFGS